MYLVLIKLDVLIIRWIRFDRILFSDIIIPRIPWSASSFGHVYNGLGHFSGRFVCDRLQNMYWISFLTIYFCWSTCMHIYNKCHMQNLIFAVYQKGEDILEFSDSFYIQVRLILNKSFVTLRKERFSKWILSLLNIFINFLFFFYIS